MPNPQSMMAPGPMNGAFTPRQLDPLVARLPRTLQRSQFIPFSYTAPFVTAFVLAASATVTFPVNVANDADFVVVTITGTVTSTDESTRLTYVPQLIQVTDNGSQTTFFDNPTHYMNVVGTAELPKYLEWPKVIKAGSTMSVTLQNLEAVARNVRLAFNGMKAYPMQSN